MNHLQRFVSSLVVGAIFTVSAVSLRAFDLSRLDQADQALLTGLNAPQVIQSLKAKALADNSLTADDVAALTPVLQAAQAKGIPLAAFMYEDWMGQDQMRRLLTIEFKRSFMNGGIASKYVPALIDAFLVARDPPPSIYSNSNYSYRQQEEFLGLEEFLRDTILDNIWFLAYPDESKRPQRSDAGPDGGNAPTLKRMLERVLADPTASFPDTDRAVLKTLLSKVDAFIANPPPLPVQRWREANAIEQAARDQLAQPPGSTTKPNLPAPAAHPSPPTVKAASAASQGAVHTSDPQASTPWSIIAVLIVAALGVLWLLLRRRW